MATLKDIAKDCNVSVSTVSRVLKGDKTLNVNSSTKDLIWTSANKFNYKVKGQTATGTKLAIINWYSHDQEVIDPYYYYIRKGVEHQCQQEQFEYDVLFKENSIDDLYKYDALVAIGKFNQSLVTKLEAFNKFIVFIDSNPDNLKFDSVQVDFEKMLEDIIEYTLEKHGPSITLLNGREYLENIKYEDPRLIAFKKQCKLKDVSNYQVIEGDFTIESGFEMMSEIIASNANPKVIICGNDLIAVGANKAAHKHGLTVGKDIFILGINNIPIAKYMVPSLTTVDIPQKQMGIEAVNLVKRRQISGKQDPIKILVPTKLIKRKSC